MQKTVSIFRSGVLAFGLLLMGAVPALAQGRGYYNQNYWGPHMMMGWGGGLFSWIFMIAFWALIIALLIAGLRWLWQASNRPGPVQPAGDRSMAILKERYAKGEINLEEFEDIKKGLAQ
jgi:putative membrane protein